MLRLGLSVLFGLCALAGAVSCALIPDPPAPNPVTPAASLANPASVNCEQKGGKLELRQDPAGGTVGICVFQDGSECDEWAYFRGTCQPGSTQSAKASASSTASSRAAPTTGAELASDGWKVYRNSQFGYSLHYPADATISHADDPLKTATITGPLIGNEYWPVIYFNHPSDREEYRPPQGADLGKWLTEHKLLTTGGPPPETRQPDVSIAGMRAIHTRVARSPQSFAYDKYWFARAQQLYSIVILHAGDKEDWDLYNHLLSSIRFD